MRNLLSILFLGVSTDAASAHYHMLIPQAPAGETSKPMSLLFQWGHPFEHQLFDTEAPAEVLVFAPDGSKTDLGSAIRKIPVRSAEGKEVAAYQISYTPPKRGDYTFIVKTRPIWVEDEKEYWQDTVKAVYHVQTQKGWDLPASQELELVPLTRPYGIAPGMAFQAQALATGTPLPNRIIEIERYNAIVPKALPDDEWITLRVKTDPNGIATTTLTHPGWWSLTAQREAGVRKRDNKSFPLKQRTTLWAFVEGR